MNLTINSITINQTRLELTQGDIAQQSTEAIVNPAPPAGAEHGAVFDVIQRAGGPQIQEEYRRIGGCPMGQVVITSGGNLPARHVIHVVGPDYNDGASNEAEMLAAVYRNCLQVAVENKLKSIAFPSISTGVRDYPVEKAAPVALGAVLDFLKNETHDLELVRFVLFHISGQTYSAYGVALRDQLLGEA